MNFTLKTIPLLAIMLVFPRAGQAQPAPIDLGTLGGTQSYPFAISDNGHVVGQSDIPGDTFTHAFLWTAASGMVDLTPFARFTTAFAVSSNGQVVGYNDGHAFSWTTTGGLVDLGTLGGVGSIALAVNASGQVVGYSNPFGDAVNHGFLWTAAGGMVDLGTLGGDSVAVAVNAHGQVVGWSGNHAFSWTATGGMVDLHTPGAYSSFAIAVNTNGQVAGWNYYLPSGESRGFSWTAAGGLVDLGTLGGRETRVFGLSDSGQVVGYSGTPPNHHAFAWTAAGGMVDLGALGEGSSIAYSVNATGDIVGSHRPGNVTEHAFWWTPDRGMVDLGTLGEPSSFAAAVNVSGQIIGVSRIRVSAPTGDRLVDRAVLWNTRRYNFRFSGVKKPPAFNEVIAGRAVSVSFSLGGNFGLAIFDEGSPTFERIACGASAGVAPIAPTSGALSGSVIYKPQVDRYAYASKTDRNWAGTCRSLTLRLNDGSSHVVYFSFK